MFSLDFDFLADDRPDNLPSRNHIVAMCKEAGRYDGGIPFPNRPSEPITAWIKYGPSVTVAEALTQDMVARLLNADPNAAVRIPRVYQAFSTEDDILFDAESNLGYIVMEYIDAPDCDEGDFQLVAEAVQSLIAVRGPSSVPGPVGGGFVVHPFFAYERSPIRYATVKELERHVNGILDCTKCHPRPVSLVDDAQDGLRLCPWDIRLPNFKKDGEGKNSKAVALNFTGACFLPPSFFAVAMATAGDAFVRNVARRVKYPQSDAVDAMVSAFYVLVFKTNDIGVPRRLLQRERERRNVKPPDRFRHVRV